MKKGERDKDAPHSYNKKGGVQESHSLLQKEVVYNKPRINSISR